MNLNTMIFDLDGTLLDTLASLGHCMNHVLEKSGYPVHPIEAYRTFIGNGMHMLAKRALPETLQEDPIAVDALEMNMRDRYRLVWQDHVSIYPYIPEVLAQLESRNICLAVLSNKPDHLARLMVRYFFPGVRFEVIRGSRPDIPLKPDPNAVFKLLQELRVPPASAALIGDSEPDILAAKSSGVLPIGVSWGFRTTQELANCGASAVLLDARELLLLKMC